jgi:uncharacterized protein (TIGR02646 family)
MKARRMVNAIENLGSITNEQHEDIKKLGSAGQIDWSEPHEDYKKIVSSFREEIKDYYFYAQGRRCCYCSIELQKHKLTYDAEHILDKSEYPEHMFDPRNLAAACKLCNGKKSNNPISKSGRRFEVLSRESEDYSIIHPHLDEWGDHLIFDSIGRIVAKGTSSKGIETIRICGMVALNVARLADEFAAADYKNAELALRTFHEVEDLTKKQELIQLLDLIAQRSGHAGANSVVDALRIKAIKAKGDGGN